MRRGRRSNILLLELLVVIAFFMVGVTILTRVFGKAGALRRQADVQVRALVYCQSLSDRLYASHEPEALLAAEGFVPEAADEAAAAEGFAPEAAGGVWSRALTDHEVLVTLADPAADGLRRWEICARDARAEVFLRLPGAKALGAGEGAA